MIKNKKTKLVISFVAVIVFMMTLFVGKTDAAEISESYLSNSQYLSGGSLTFSDLAGAWQLFCSQRGMHIPSASSGATSDSSLVGHDNTGTKESTTTDSSAITQDILDNHQQSVTVSGTQENTSSVTYYGQVFSQETPGLYSAGSAKIATPKEAYILNDAQANAGGYYSEVQQAWWTTPGGHLGGDVGTNTLSKTADDYQTFVKKIAKNVNNTSTYRTLKHSVNGNEVSIGFPEINEEKLKVAFNTVSEDGKVIKKRTNKWYANVTVNHTDTKTIIGPFSINYVEANSNGVDFGKIDRFDIYTDASSEPLDNSKWRFVWQDEKRKDSDYPHSNEVFYIEMDRMENVTKITGMDVEYKYLIAGAEYQYLDGHYDINNYEIKRIGKTERKDDDGNVVETTYKYGFQKTGTQTGTSQTLAVVKRAARWYETTTLRLGQTEESSNEGSIEIKKVAKDENGNELTADQVKEKFGEYQYFDFKVKIKHSDGEEEEDVLTVRAGSSVMKTYSWSGEESAPTFTVEEIPVSSERWKEVSVTPTSGQLENGNTIEVTAVNQITEPKSNKIQIKKTLSGPADENEEFKFQVVVTMPDGTKDTQEATINVPQGQETGNTWVSKEYEWYGEKNPTYEIIEIETEASKKYNAYINPSSGELDGTGANIEVNAFNNEITTETYQNQIEITKTISSPAETDETFKFEVIITKADGTELREEATILVPQGQTTGAEWLSQIYTWQKGEKAPTYEIKEIETEDSKRYEPTITPSAGSLDGTKSKIQVTALNRRDLKEYQNVIEINKTIEGGVADKDEVFTFKVTVTEANGSKHEETATITVPKGQTTGEAWISNIYQWQEGEEAPTYTVEEINVPSEYTAEVIPSSGSLDGTKAKVVVNAINHKKEHKGSLTIEKALKEGQTDETFDFKVTVDGVKNTESGHMEFTVSGVKPGEKRGPYEFVWVGDTAPTYTVEEINLSDKKATLTSIEAVVNGKSTGTRDGNKITGTLVADGTAQINVKFTNQLEKHSSKIKVEKDVYTTEKISKETLEKDGTKFEIEVVIEGTFVYEGTTIQDSTKVISKKLPDDGKWSFETSDIVWYGQEAPTFTVREKNLPTGWRTKTISYSDLENESTDSEGHNLVDGKTVSVKIVNELPSTTVIDLTFSMGGLVWVDQDPNDKDTSNDGYNASKSNGVYDKGRDILKENAEVTVYRVVYDKAGNEVSRTVAKAYKDADNNELTFPIVTKSDGKWDVPRISMPTLSEEEQSKGYSVSYDVEFAYDGETYEPAEFLSYQVKGENITKNTGSNAEKANAYINAEPETKDNYAKDSMAIEVSNEAKRIAEVSGKTAIDSNGDTTGKVTLEGGEQHEIMYSCGNAGTYPTISKVNTNSQDGNLLDIFRATARTSAGNLTFPFDVNGYDGTTLSNVNKTITEAGVKTEYKFHAIYNYCLNINLGLKERESADIGLTKKLTTANVVVNEKLYQYNYSGKYDLTEDKTDTLDKDIIVSGEQENIEYTLDLYKSDYYYRAAMYRNNEEIYGKLKTFYKSFNKIPEDTEMDIYLTYQISLQNNSANYDVVINSIDDYYDSSLSLVRVDESKYVKTVTVGAKEEDFNDTYKVANASDYADKWQDVKTGIVGSDKDGDGNNIVYNKMTADNLGIKLEPGGSSVITMTFKVTKGKDKDYAISNSIKLGQKCNVAEIGSYTTYFTGTSNYAGKFDRDSAPGNVNISANNTKGWYEDDTFAAPILKVNIKTENGSRTVSGLAWEDDSSDKNTESPYYNQQVGDGIMNGDEKVIQELTTELVEKVLIGNADGTDTYTEYNYIWPTGDTLDCLNGRTIETVTGFDSTIITGEGGQYQFGNIVAGDYVVRFTYGDKPIASQEYSKAEYYNGQDYKSTTYKAIVKDDENNTKYVNPSKYLDIDATNGLTEHRNTAVDSELRRLEVVEKSREITNSNATVMANYDENSDLYKDYYMFADTPKIDMNLETIQVNHIDFGLEERPITKLTLDKQIEEMMLTTNDGKTILDAKYNINYTIDEKGEITVDVTLDESNSYGIENLQNLNRDSATNQGFRYINVDSDILEGTTLTVKYRFTVLNTGEVDRTGKLATMEYNADDTQFKTSCEELATALATYQKTGNRVINEKTMGDYVGSIYYYGASSILKDDISNEPVVTSTVRQLVDYIDNDVTFSGILNATKDTSWSNVTASELKELVMREGIVTQDENGKDIVVDKDGVLYETENRNNLVVSVDSDDEANTLNNKGFIIELKPYKAGENNYQASMNLTVTRYMSSDSDDLQVDNVAEIIKYNNKVGRRDELTIPGNLVPAKAWDKNTSLTTTTTVSTGMEYEPDTSATEVITLSPPTGSGLMTWKLQVIGSITAGLVIIAGGVVIIKKKILK